MRLLGPAPKPHGPRCCVQNFASCTDSLVAVGCEEKATPLGIEHLVSSSLSVRILHECEEEPESRFSGSFYLCILSAMRDLDGRILWVGLTLTAYVALSSHDGVATSFSQPLLIWVQNSDADRTNVVPDDPIVAPVKRMAPQMPANAAKPSASKSDTKENDKRSAPAKQKQAQ
jgi:hypothetical protein